jgi:putative hemolysin
MITVELFFIFILLALNAFFALSEMAIVSSSKPLLRQMAKKGHKRATLALNLAEDSGRFLSTVQVGITLVGILAGAYGGATIADKLEPAFNQIPLFYPHGEIIAVIVVVSAITYFSVILGELIPKQFALSKPETLAIWTAPPMKIISVVFAPVVIFFEFSANVFFWILRIPQNSEKVTEAEVKAIISEGAASGAIEKSEHDMFQRIIRLDERDVKSIMTHRKDIIFIDIHDSFASLQEKLKQAQYSRYPVIDGDPSKVIGVLHAKELLTMDFTNPKELQLSRHIKEIPALLETSKCLTALELFKSAATHIAIVVDEYGSTEGIITASDILEAIVGVMPANYDINEQPMIVQLEDGSWLVDGSTPVDEIHLSIGLEEIDANSSYETIAGFLLFALERTPNVGEHLERFGYRFKVVDLDGHRIDKVLISKLSKINAVEA